MTPILNREKAHGDKLLTIWRLTDGKPGHENQSLGLCNALARQVTTDRHDIPVGGRSGQLLQWLSGRFPAGRGLPVPDLIVGAGHRTHPALLAARRAFGGRAVVIMNPTLPRSLFDLCVIPEHDQVSGANVCVTQGVMNTLYVGMRNTPTQTLLLLGGASPHYNWQDEAVISQVESIVRQQPAERFLLSDSRRTPAGCLAKIAALELANLTLFAWQQTAPGWVAEQLGLSRAAWVSEDSVSMVYEALTSGAAVGLITLEQTKPGRVSSGVRRLVETGWVMPFDAWHEQGGLTAPPGTFNEAERCARWMVEQWL